MSSLDTTDPASVIREHTKTLARWIGTGTGTDPKAYVADINEALDALVADLAGLRANQRHPDSVMLTCPHCACAYEMPSVWFTPDGCPGCKRVLDTEEELAGLRADLAAARYLGDNHHNAAACPYCGDLLGKSEAEAKRLRGTVEQLTAALTRLEAVRRAAEKFKRGGTNMGDAAWEKARDDLAAALVAASEEAGPG